MELRKGFFGMFVLVVLIAGFLTFAYLQTGRAVTRESGQVLVNEIHADRLALVRNVILKSYRNVSAGNELAWSIAVQQELAPAYGVDAYFDYSGAPAKAVVYDPVTGMRTVFWLT